MNEGTTISKAKFRTQTFFILLNMKYEKGLNYLYANENRNLAYNFIMFTLNLFVG